VAGKRRVRRESPACRFRGGDAPGVRYCSGPVILDEFFSGGRLMTRYWSACGQVLPEMYVGSLAWGREQPADAFGLCANGNDLAGGYEWVSASAAPDPSRWRADGRTVAHAVVHLRHRESRVKVDVHTRLDGGPFIIRWLEVTNESKRSVGITGVWPFGGMLWSHRCDEHMPPGRATPFELAYNHIFEWGQEGDFWPEPLPPGVRSVDGGRKGRSGWGRPAFWARNLCNGQTFVCELAWGGNYEFALDCRIIEPDPAAGRRRWAEMFFRMGLSGHDPVLRVLAAGETIATPAVHLGLFQADDDAVVQATHEHVRRVVMPAQMPGCHIEIEANHRGYLCDRENEPDLKRDVDVAAEIGAEMYVIDAGWYGKEPNRWWNNTGDWHAGPWLPNGLEPVREHARKRGMRFGLWVEIEAAGANSDLRRNHPEWLIVRDGQPIAGGRALDLTRPEVAAWVESEIERIIRQYDLDMFRIDHNHCIAPSGNRKVDGMTEDVTWRYYDSLYAIFDRVRARCPRVVFQNCAGGGGRLDWGTLSRFHNSELSDWMRQPRGLKILNGVTMSLPPEVLLRTFGTEVGEHALDADVDTQLRLVCLCRPIFRGIAPSVEELTPHLRERIEHHLGLYRKFIRPILAECRVYHHTPFLPVLGEAPWCVLEYADADGARAVVGLFRTSACGDDTFVLRPRGIDAGRTYRVTFDNSGQSATWPGAQLKNEGLRVRLDRPLTSELILFEAKGVGRRQA